MWVKKPISLHDILQMKQACECVMNVCKNFWRSFTALVATLNKITIHTYTFNNNNLIYTVDDSSKLENKREKCSI